MNFTFFFPNQVRPWKPVLLPFDTVTSIKGSLLYAVEKDMKLQGNVSVRARYLVSKRVHNESISIHLS